MLSDCISGRACISSECRRLRAFRDSLQLSQNVYWSSRERLLPKPKCIVYTNLACDANLLTFHRLAEFYHVPVFSIDVPSRQTASNVAYVAAQLRALKRFLEQTTGRLIDEDLLAERVARGRETLEEFEKFQSARQIVLFLLIWYRHCIVG